MINIGSIWESSRTGTMRKGQLLVVEQVYTESIYFRSVSLHLTHDKYGWPIEMFLRDFKLIKDVKQ